VLPPKRNWRNAVWNFVTWTCIARFFITAFDILANSPTVRDGLRGLWGFGG
jgi:hypothetical protein